MGAPLTSASAPAGGVRWHPAMPKIRPLTTAVGRRKRLDLLTAAPPLTESIEERYIPRFKCNQSPCRTGIEGRPRGAPESAPKRQIAPPAHGIFNNSL
jgi:hypothetical protein